MTKLKKGEKVSKIKLEIMKKEHAYLQPMIETRVTGIDKQKISE